MTPSPKSTALSATVHCLTGCAIGEVAGMVRPSSAVAAKLDFSSDTFSIPVAMKAGLESALFWITLPVSLIVAGVAAFPVNLWLISRGRGHAIVHQHHHPGHHQSREA